MATDGDSRAIAAASSRGQVRPLDHFQERLARGEAQAAELLHEDRVRAHLADRVAQRLVEARG